jgi:hypothetical protein
MTTAEKVGVPYNYGFHFEELAEQIIIAAQSGGKLPSPDYRAIWTIWSIFRWHNGRTDG